MEKIRTLLSRKYYLLSSHIFLTLKSHKEHEESIVLEVTNNGGEISFSFTDLNTNDVTSFVNPVSGSYIVRVNKNTKIKLLILAKGAIGSYKISRKIVVE